MAALYRSSTRAVGGPSTHKLTAKERYFGKHHAGVPLERHRRTATHYLVNFRRNFCVNPRTHESMNPPRLSLTPGTSSKGGILCQTPPPCPACTPHKGCAKLVGCIYASIPAVSRRVPRSVGFIVANLVFPYLQQPRIFVLDTTFVSVLDPRSPPRQLPTSTFLVTCATLHQA